MSPVLFYIFINNLDKEVKETIMESAEDSVLGGVPNIVDRKEKN